MLCFFICYIMLCYVLCFALLYVMLCIAICYVMLCFTICYVMLSPIALLCYALKMKSILVVLPKKIIIYKYIYWYISIHLHICIIMIMFYFLRVSFGHSLYVFREKWASSPLIGAPRPKPKPKCYLRWVNVNVLLAAVCGCKIPSAIYACRIQLQTFMKLF